MDLGLTWGTTNAEEWARALELRPAWTKLACNLSRDTSMREVEYEARLVDSAGIRVVIDLRCEVSWFGRTADPAQWEWQRRAWENDTMFDEFAARVEKLVHNLAPVCCDWELWGEAPCRWTGQSFWRPLRYARMVEQAAAAIRRAQPNARVWLGGHGVNGDLVFWRDLEELGTLPYDVNNLHCFCHDRDWTTVENLLTLMFNTIRSTERSRHALGCTEFGWPTHPDGAGVPFASHVQDSVLSLDEDTAAQWLDRSLRLFDRHDLREVCVIGLRDGKPGGTHWGDHLGLYRYDWTPKPMLEVWRDWRRTA